MQVRSSQHRQHEGEARHAIVVGGSIGGMLTARVLADHFDRVTIIERDQLPDGSENRPGVPHARHLHFFFKRAKTIESFYGSTEAQLERVLAATGF